VPVRAPGEYVQREVHFRVCAHANARHISTFRTHPEQVRRSTSI
jgi:hypothetical protein